MDKVVLTVTSGPELAVSLRRAWTSRMAWPHVKAGHVETLFLSRLDYMVISRHTRAILGKSL
jgi:hypothetical protein